jgi:hypothetical protein
MLAMPDFLARIASGALATPWSDARANVDRARPSKYHRAIVGSEVAMHAVVGGVGAPLDTALDGRLFSSDLGEWPAPYGPTSISSPAGQSSIQRFTPPAAGHYLWWIRRADGGAVGIHLDAEAAP